MTTQQDDMISALTEATLDLGEDAKDLRDKSAWLFGILTCLILFTAVFGFVTIDNLFDRVEALENIAYDIEPSTTYGDSFREEETLPRPSLVR